MERRRERKEQRGKRVKQERFESKTQVAVIVFTLAFQFFFFFFFWCPILKIVIKSADIYKTNKPCNLNPSSGPCTYCGSSHSWVLSESLLTRSYQAYCLEPWSGWGWVWCWWGEKTVEIRVSLTAVLTQGMHSVWQFTVILTRWGCTPASACCLPLLPLVVSVKQWMGNGFERRLMHRNQTVLFGIFVPYYSYTCWM